jgi:pyruvate dehydrogenase E1 component alpha subunit
MAAAGMGAAYLSTAGKVAKADSFFDFGAVDLTDDQLVTAYRTMLKIRWYDRTVIDSMLTVRGFRGYAHPSPGEEAGATAVGMILGKDDWIQGTHRSHHHALGKGADLKAMAAEITYKQGGTNNGYGGSMHIMQKNVGMLGETGIIGTGQIIGAGAAFGAKANGRGQVVLTYGGDGHMSSPYMAIALSNAVKFKLPHIVFLENNGYEISMPISACHPHLTQYTNVPRGYGMPGYTVDGQSFMNVYGVLKMAVERARAGEGPTFIESKTYRYYDHFGPGGAKPGVLGARGLSYRSDREVTHWIGKDPIALHRQTLINYGILDDAKATQVENDVKAEVAAAFDWANSQPVPRAEDGLANVHFSGPAILPRQLASCPLYEGFKPVV